jgi:hypothetical protein
VDAVGSTDSCRDTAGAHTRTRRPASERKAAHRRHDTTRTFWTSSDTSKAPTQPKGGRDRSATSPTAASAAATSVGTKAAASHWRLTDGAETASDAQPREERPLQRRQHRMRRNRREQEQWRTRVAFSTPRRVSESGSGSVAGDGSAIGMGVSGSYRRGRGEEVVTVATAPCHVAAPPWSHHCPGLNLVFCHPTSRIPGYSQSTLSPVVPSKRTACGPPAHGNMALPTVMATMCHHWHDRPATDSQSDVSATATSQAAASGRLSHWQSSSFPTHRVLLHRVNVIQDQRRNISGLTGSATHERTASQDLGPVCY